MFWFITFICLVGTYYFLRRSVEQDRLQQDVMQSYTRAVDALDSKLPNEDRRRDG